MSAELLATEPVKERSTPTLRVVTNQAAKVSTLGFVMIIVSLVMMGLVAVMVLTTTVNAQSKELSKLQREATQLGYQAAALETDYERVASTNALALRAAELGMVPNPYPAFIKLADGSISGVPTPVKGNEMPYLRGTASSAKTNTERVSSGNVDAQSSTNTAGLTAAAGAGATEQTTTTAASQTSGTGR